MTYRLNKVSLRGIGRKKLFMLAVYHERVARYHNADWIS
jgi:hypothetical protein